MTMFLLVWGLLAQAPATSAENPAPSAEAAERQTIDYLRRTYRAEAERQTLHGGCNPCELGPTLNRRSRRETK